MNVISGQKSLKQRIIRGSGWSLLGHFVSQMIRLGGNLITTRFLVPEMFGVMVIANVLFIGIEMFSDLGIRQNIVQSKRGDDPVFLNTAWTLQILRGILLSAIVLILSGLLYVSGQAGWIPDNSVYADTRLPYVIAVLSLTPLIGGLESTKIATVRRHLMLGHLTLVEVLAQFSGPAVIITVCYFDRSIWALVAGWFAVSLTRMILSHIMLPGIGNRLGWDRESFNTLYHFGKWIFLSSILGFLLKNGDRILFGIYLSAKEMGIYSIAFLMISAMELLLRKLIDGISFPALSEIYRQQPGRLATSYYKFRLPIDLVSLFMMGVIANGGQAVIDILYDDRYREAGWMLQILAFSLFFIRFEVAGLCYLVMDKPKLLTAINFIRTAGVYLIVPVVFVQFGFKWAIFAVAVNYVIALPLVFYFNKINGLFSFGNEIKVLPVVIPGLVFGSLLTLFLTELTIFFQRFTGSWYAFKFSGFE